MTPLDDEGRALVAAHVGLATHLANLAVPRRSPDGEDARSAALLALSQSASDYVAGDVPFGAFARVKIQWALRDFLRRQRPLGYRERPDGTPRIRSMASVPEPSLGLA